MFLSQLPPVPSATSHPWYQLSPLKSSQLVSSSSSLVSLSLARLSLLDTYVTVPSTPWSPTGSERSPLLPCCFFLKLTSHCSFTLWPPLLHLCPVSLPTLPIPVSSTQHPATGRQLRDLYVLGSGGRAQSSALGRVSLSLGDLQECCLSSPDSPSHLLLSSWPGASWGPVTWFRTLTHCLGHCCHFSVRYFHEPAVLRWQDHLHVSLPSLCWPTFRTRTS